MNEKELPFDAVAALDQLEAHAVNVAQIISSYYKKLIAEGVPENLVFPIVVEFSISIWSLIFDPKKKE